MLTTNDLEQTGANGEVEPAKVRQGEVPATVDMTPQVQIVGPHTYADHGFAVGSE
jgi:hypothetical protein